MFRPINRSSSGHR